MWQQDVRGALSAREYRLATAANLREVLRKRDQSYLSVMRCDYAAPCQTEVTSREDRFARSHSAANMALSQGQVWVWRFHHARSS